MITINVLKDQRTMNAVIMQDPYITLLHAQDNPPKDFSLAEFDLFTDILHRCRMQLLIEPRVILHRNEMIKRQEELRARSARRSA